MHLALITCEAEYWEVLFMGKINVRVRVRVESKRVESGYKEILSKRVESGYKEILRTLNDII